MEEKKIKRRRTLKKIKDTSLSIRMTIEKKEKLKKFCKKNDMSVTQFINYAMESFILEEELE